MPYICGILQNLEDKYSQLCRGLSLLDSLHPLQWVKCSFLFLQSMFPVRCLMLCNSCLRVLQSPSHLCSVYPLAYHQNVSVSRQAVFVKSFVIILRPPLGSAPRHLYKYVPLRVTLYFSIFAGRFGTWNKSASKCKRCIKTCWCRELAFAVIGTLLSMSLLFSPPSSVSLPALLYAKQKFKRLKSGYEQLIRNIL